MRFRRAIWAMVTLAACGAASSGENDAASETYVGCTGDPRVNLSSFPGDVALDAAASLPAVRLHFLTANPSVPLAGENTWTFEFQAADGSLLTETAGTTIQAAAFMPDHGHPRSVTPTVSLQADGKWQIENLFLTMGGIWRVTFTISTSEGKRTAVVYVCAAS